MMRLPLLLLSIGLAGCGLPRAELDVAPEVDVGLVARPMGRVGVPVANRGRGPGRVVGAPEACYDALCVRPGPGVPAVIPPGQTVAADLELAVREPGPFRQAVTLHLDDGSLRTVTVVLVGVGGHGPPFKPNP